MARRAHTKELYDKILEGYRLHPGLHRQAAEAAGVGVGVAKRAWSEGWAGKPWGEPIERVVHREGEAHQVARAAAMRAAREAEAAEAEKRQARYRTAIEREEGLLDEASKGIKLAAVTVQNLVPAVSSCLKQLQAATAPGAPALSTRECRAIVDLFVKTAGRVAYAADALVKLSRLDRGAATVTFASGTDPDDVSEAESIEELEAAAEILRQYKEDSDGTAQDDGSKELH